MSKLNNLLATPGIYMIATIMGDYFFVETMPDGTCQQLTIPNLEHDGELSREGWNEQLIELSLVIGPVFRKPTA